MDSTPVCPYCNGSVTLLSLVSSVSVTDFYRCDECEKVSESAKGSNSPHALETKPDAGAKSDEAAARSADGVWTDLPVNGAFDRQFFFTGWRRAL